MEMNGLMVLARNLLKYAPDPVVLVSVVLISPSFVAAAAVNPGISNDSNIPVNGRIDTELESIPAQIVAYYFPVDQEPPFAITPEVIRESGIKIEVALSSEYGAPDANNPIQLIRSYLKGAKTSSRFNRLITRLRIDSPQLIIPILVDQEGVVSNGALEYQLNPLSFLRLTRLMERLSSQNRTVPFKMPTGRLDSSSEPVCAKGKVSSSSDKVASRMTYYYLPFTSITEVDVTENNARIELDRYGINEPEVAESIYRYLKRIDSGGKFNTKAIRLVVEPYGQHTRYMLDYEGVVRAGGKDYQISPRDYCLLNHLLESFKDEKEASKGMLIPIEIIDPNATSKSLASPYE